MNYTKKNRKKGILLKVLQNSKTTLSRLPILLNLVSNGRPFIIFWCFLNFSFAVMLECNQVFPQFPTEFFSFALATLPSYSSIQPLSQTRSKSGTIVVIVKMT